MPFTNVLANCVPGASCDITRGNQTLLKKQLQSGNQLFSSEGTGTVLRHQFQGHIASTFLKWVCPKEAASERVVGDEHASSPHCMTSLQVSSLTVHMRAWFAYKSIQAKESSLALACHAQNVFSIYNLSSTISILGTLTQF